MIMPKTIFQAIDYALYRKNLHFDLEHVNSIQICTLGLVFSAAYRLYGT